MASVGITPIVDAARAAYTSSRALTEKLRRYMPMRSKSMIHSRMPNTTACRAPASASRLESGVRVNVAADRRGQIRYG